MEIENQNILQEAFKNGVNIFLGAGFSVLAKDHQERFLPTGQQLCEELKSYFKVTQNYTLSQLALVLERKNKQEFYSFLSSRFDVKSFDPIYYSINNINLKGIFTTNIDNLIHQIFEKNQTKYLNDLSINGPILADKTSVDYSALHGCILNTNRPLTFDSLSISTTFSHSPNTWNVLADSILKFPTIFLGYGLNDAGILQALSTVEMTKKVPKEKWILLRNSDQSEYFQSLGFNIINGDTEKFLKYISTQSFLSDKQKTEDFSDIKQIFPNNIVPSSSIQLRVRPINDFFLGNPPIWSDIYSKQIATTSHYTKIKDKLYSTKHLIVLGTPASGKTTLLMQLAAFTEYKSIKLVSFHGISLNKAELLIKILNDREAMIFIDNFSDSIEAFEYLSSQKNIKVIGFERQHNFGIVSHIIDDTKYEFHNVTQLTDKDIQDIYNSLPLSLRNPELRKEFNADYEKDSLFEFVNRNVKLPKIKDRFRQVLDQLDMNNSDLSEFLTLCCYIHYTRTPVSFDMLYSYFSDENIDFDYIFRMRDELGDLVKEYGGEFAIDEDQDYYYPRSIYLAETILKIVKPGLLKTVINKTLKNIPTFKICNYKVFRKKAYDKNIISDGFKNWQEGKKFYEEAFINDFNNPYVLQQGALYLARKEQYTEAFHWIDRALTLTDDKYFSIRNSHAIILFDANISSREQNSSIQGQLDKSMEILEKCYHSDYRKNFHAIRYANQALQYHDRYNDSKAVTYLNNSHRWLKEEHNRQKWNTEISQLLSKVTTRINF